MPRYIVLNPKWKDNECLEKKEILFFGNQLLANPQDLTCMRTMNPDLIYFLLKCITDLIHHQKHFKFSTRQKKDVCNILKPYKNKYMRLADYKKRNLNINLIQRGKGVFISSLIAAVAPMIYSLVKKAVTAIRKIVKK